ncbi:cation diffusion facilitator family transporter [uncultured Microbacterium sp.]|uniref:cation transporter dimerization domain-containing protein n=1 Tax=uncultured Microbacterium sp. TaxID=191216 RepID=UPI002602BFDE|nr:cation transporter dimerization domain-containing protein [uncultured Microbacterium sp.]
MSAPTDKKTLDLIMDAIIGCADVEKLINLKTLPTDDGLVVAAKVALPGDRTVREVADRIDEIETGIRATVPGVRSVYIQPDIYRPSLDPEPSTDVFVLKSED